MELLIQVKNISQIRQIAESLSEDVLVQSTLNGEPLTDYLQNNPIFSGKNGVFSVECLCTEFILNSLNVGQLLNPKEQVIADLEHAKINNLFEVWHDRIKLASFSNYYGLQIFLGNLHRESLPFIDVHFLNECIRGDKLMRDKPRWFLQYSEETGRYSDALFSSEPLDDLILKDWGCDYMSIWDLNHGIFRGILNNKIRKYWTSTTKD